MSDHIARVLIVDGSSDSRAALGSWLARLGWSVEFCTSGTDALEMLQTRDYDFVITEMHSPDLDGRSLIHWIRTNRPNTDVLVLTDSNSQRNMRFALMNGVRFYMVKPVEPQVVVDALLSLLDGGTRQRVAPASCR